MDSALNLGMTAKDVDLVIATPFYNVQAYAPYTASLVSSIQLCHEIGIKVVYWQICGDSYVWHVRNQFAHEFLHNTDAKYLLFIDSDHAWDLPGFANILKSQVDVVGAAYPCKNNWEFWSVTHAVDDDGIPLGDARTGLIHAYKVPTGMMKISRRAFELIEENEPDNFYIEQTGKIHAFFSHIVQDSRSYGEDISFCIRCERVGIPLWIQPNVTVQHFGVEAHTGNYHDFLRRRPGGELHGSVRVASDSVKHLAGIYKDSTCYIVGKGPSLENLKASDFGEGPVITMNHAVVKVEQLCLPNRIFSMQKDGCGNEVMPKAATVVVHSRESDHSFLGYKPRYVFDNPDDFDLTVRAPSIMSATSLAHLMGCKKIVYLCCDGVMGIDDRTAIPMEDGSIDIGISDPNYEFQDGSVRSLLEHLDIQCEWCKPEAVTIQ